MDTQAGAPTGRRINHESEQTEREFRLSCRLRVVLHRAMSPQHFHSWHMCLSAALLSRVPARLALSGLASVARIVHDPLSTFPRAGARVPPHTRAPIASVYPQSAQGRSRGAHHPACGCRQSLGTVERLRTVGTSGRQPYLPMPAPAPRARAEARTVAQHRRAMRLSGCKCRTGRRSWHRWRW